MTEEGISRRISWGLGDQAISSVTNFGLSIVVARSVDLAQFGMFSVIFASYLLLLGGSRAISSEPLSVRFSSSSKEEWRRGAVAATGLALLAGIVGGLALSSIGVFLGGSTGSSLLALGVVLPGLLLQDAWRFAFFTLGRGNRALANDLLWAICFALGVCVVYWTDRLSVVSFLLAWGSAGTVAALVGIVQSAVIPNPLLAKAWWREHVDLGARYFGEFLTTAGVSQVALYGVGLVAGISAAGALRGAQLILGPINIVYMGVILMAVPEAVRLLVSSSSAMKLWCVRLSGALGCLVLTVTLVVLMVPSSAGESLLGPTWNAGRALVVPVGLSYVATSATLGAATGLRALADSRRSLRIRLITALVTLFGATVGALLGDARLAAWGIALAGILGAFLWWHGLLAAISDSEKKGAEHKKPSSPVEGILGS